MNIEIISLNPFKVTFRLYNLLGEIDGHPKVLFDMETGDWSLVHDKGFANLVSMSEHPKKGEPLILAPDSPMWPAVRKQVEERIGHTGFHDQWATKAFNRFCVGDIKYPRYFFTMWSYDKKGEPFHCHHIGEEEYEQLKAWSEGLK